MYSATVLLQRLNVGVGITKDRRCCARPPVATRRRLYLHVRHVYSQVHLGGEMGCMALTTLIHHPSSRTVEKRHCGERLPQGDQCEETNDLADDERRPNGMVDGRRRWYIFSLANVCDRATPTPCSFSLRQPSSSEISPVNPPFWPPFAPFPFYHLSTPSTCTVGARAKRSGSAASTRVCVRVGTTAKPARHSGLRSQ